MKYSAPVDLRTFQTVCGIRHFATGRPTERDDRPYTEVGRKYPNDNRWPWLVGITGYENVSRNCLPLCVGSIITRRYVITAAYCFYKRPNLEVDAYAVEVFSDSPTSTDRVQNLKRIDSYHIRPDYDPFPLYNDIALVRVTIRFEEPFMPICLPTPDYVTSNIKSKTILVPSVENPGQSDSMSNTPSMKKSGESLPYSGHSDIHVLNTNICGLSYDRDNKTHRADGTQICANYPQGTYACEIGRGSPLMLQEESELWTLIGVSSPGLRCEDIGLVGVHSRIASYQRFIGDTLHFDAQ